MQRKFLSNVLITLGANLLVKPLWILGVDRTFQNRLGLESYGVYTNLFTFSVVLGLLLDFGINNYNASSLARNPGLLNQQFLPLALLKVLLSVAYLLLTFLLGYIYGYGSHELYLLFILSINQCLAYGFTYMRSTLSGLQRYQTDALISTADRLTMVVGGLALLMCNLFSISIESFVYLQTVGYLMAFVVGWLALRPFIPSFLISFDIKPIKAVFVQSAPYAILALLMMVYSRSDVLLIRKLLPEGNAENGIYAQSTRLLEAVNMMAVLVSGLLLPMFSSLIQNKEPLTPLVRQAMLLLWVPAIIGVLWCTMYSQTVLPLLYHQYDFYHAEVFVWSFASVIPLCMMYVFGTLLTAAGRLRLLIKLAAVAVALNLVLNSVLIPQYGAKGAAITLLITHGFMGLSNTVVALILMPISISVGYFVRFVVFAGICLIILLLLSAWQCPIGIGIGVYGVCILPTIWLLRLVDPEQISKLLKRFRNQ